MNKRSMAIKMNIACGDKKPFKNPFKSVFIVLKVLLNELPRPGVRKSSSSLSSGCNFLLFHKVGQHGRLGRQFKVCNGHLELLRMIHDFRCIE